MVISGMNLICWSKIIIWIHSVFSDMNLICIKVIIWGIQSFEKKYYGH